MNGERLITDIAKEVLRKQLWLVAEFCGLQVVTYQILSNHFHVLVRVPQKTEIPDEELLRRYLLLHPHPTRYQTARLEVIKARLAENGSEAEAWRRRMLALMNDVSQYMKLLKQRFSIWLNKSYNRFGTLWAERFKSVLVEGTGDVLQTMAAYIDLNCVRASLADDPKDYRFGGYAEAVAGDTVAREGIRSIFGGAAWDQVQTNYRRILFGKGTAPQERGGRISAEAFEQVMIAGGKLALADVLRCRVRYLTNGAVLGSRAFVETQLAAYRIKTGRREQTGPRMLPAIADWGDLAVLRRVRQPTLS